MNIVDVIILLTLGLGAVVGFARGFFKQTVISLGTIVVVVLSFILKNPLSMVLYENLPFFKFSGLTSLNILLYETLAFLICLSVLCLTLSLVIKISNIIEKLVDLTIIFALPSKILGMIVGLIQNIVIVYVALFILTIPVFNVPFLSESKYAKIILNKTPIISDITNDAVKAFNEIAEFTTKEININDIDNTNSKIVDIMLKNDVVKIESIKMLNDKEKIKLLNIDELIDKYKED